MTTVPSNLVPTRISQLTEYTGDSTDGYLPYVYQGITYKVKFGNIAAVGAVPSTRTITGADGLTGGGDLSANRVISLLDGGVTYSKLADSGVVAGQYGSATSIPVLDIDAKGRVTIATTTPISLSGYVPTSRAIIAGDGLTGGGTLTTDRTISLELTAAEPLPGGIPVAGNSTIAARDDHVHPAVDLSDTTETSGVLPMSRGGTGSSLSPAAGAILYSTGSQTALSDAGDAGQFFVSGGVAGPSWYDLTGGSTGLDFTFTGSSYDLGGTLAVASGGTGATTVQTARVNLLPSYTGNGGKALTLNAGATDVEWTTISGLGTVTSVDVSGGTTGLTTSGGPIDAAGTITLGGTLNTTAGGTGLSSYTAGDLVYYASGDALTKLGIGTGTYLLTSSGTAPQWSNPTGVVVGRATNITGGTAGSIPYQTSANTTTMLAAGTGVLIGGSTPSYTSSPSLTQVTVAADPTLALQVATKQYVDTLVASGISYHAPVKYEVPDTTGDLNALYNQPGGAGVGVGATLTNNGTKAPFAPDGPTASVGDRILVYNQTNAFENGVYTVTTVGTSDPGGTNWVLTRATDADTYGVKSPTALGSGDAFFVTSGGTGAGETYVMNTAGVITFGTTAITFVQVSDATLYTAGTGLTLTSGTVFSITPVGTAGTYGSASQVPVVTTNASGQVTTVTNTAIAIAASQVTSGTFSIAQGGTGQTTASAAFNALSPITATGDLIVGNGTNSATRLGIGANGYLLTSDGTTAVWAAAPASMVYPGAGIAVSTGSAWGTSYSVSGSGNVALTTSPAFTTPDLGTPSAATLTNATGLPIVAGTTGTLSVARGGTGATSLTANNVILGNGTSAVQVVAPSTSGNVLTSDGTTWVSQAPAATGVSQAKAIAFSMILGL